MASRLPDNREKMMAIVGVGEITFRKYGSAFLDLISKWKRVEEGCVTLGP
jgi:superfamily II DNA helicase RecQ